MLRFVFLQILSACRQEQADLRVGFDRDDSTSEN